MYNNPNIDLININAYTKFSEILSICSQDIEWKWNYDERNDKQPKTSIAPLLQSGAIKKHFNPLLQSGAIKKQFNPLLQSGAIKNSITPFYKVGL